MSRMLPLARGTRWLERDGHGATIGQLRAALRKAASLPNSQIDQKTECEARFVLTSYGDKIVTSLELTGEPINEQDARYMKLIAPAQEKAGAPDWPKRSRGRPRNEEL